MPSAQREQRRLRLGNGPRRLLDGFIGQAMGTLHLRQRAFDRQLWRRLALGGALQKSRSPRG